MPTAVPAAAAAALSHTSSWFPAININFEITGLLLALIAVGALLFAREQIRQMQTTNSMQVESLQKQELQMRATVLLALDERWESASMQEVRGEMEALIRGAKNEALDRWPGQREIDLRNRSAEIYAAILQDFRINDPERYIRLFRVCGFFETVGYVAKTGYIPVDDVVNLLGVAIVTAGMVFQPHITKLLAEEGAEADLYSCFLWLLGEAERRL
jgi:hypothetical protein